MSQKTLKDFFQDIQDWIDQGCPDENEAGFSDVVGLCTNLDMWMDHHQIFSNHKLLLLQDFEGRGWDTQIPFGYRAWHKYQVLENYPPRHREEVVSRLAYIKEKLK